MNAKLAAVIFLSVAMPATSTCAAVTVYTSRAAWEIAVANNFVTENFNSLTTGPLSSGLNSAGLFDIRVNGLVSGNQFTSGLFAGETSSQFGRTQDFVFPSAVSGFGGDWLLATTSAHLTVTINDETIQFDNYLAGNGNGFLGFVSSSPFAEARFDDEGHSGNEQYLLDNLSFATVPEPAAGALMIVVGLLSLCVRARRRA